LIGKALKDKNPKIGVVVNKIGEITSQYRYFNMEVIGSVDGNGNDGPLETEVKEGGSRFKMDFRKVYWNSRLQYEHKRLSDQIVEYSKENGCVVADVMCGIGPFAIPLSKSPAQAEAQVYVHANDLNPTSYKYLNENVKLNKISEDRISTYNLDGRDFVRELEVSERAL